MIDDKTVIAIIPARGGSKGIRNKNIKSFCGMPLIAHSISQAKNSQYIDKVIVSTEDDRIKNIALDYKAEIPFKRPGHLSDDKASNIDVIIHALNQVKSDVFIILQPTSPLRTVYDIDKCLELLSENAYKMIISAAIVKNYPYSFVLNSSGMISDNKLKNITTNRQDYNQYYTVNGAIYLSLTDYFLDEKSFFTEHTYVYKMPQEKSIDIDEMDDWTLAEKLFQDI